MRKFLFLTVALLTAVFSTRAAEVTPPACATYEYYTATTYLYKLCDDHEWQATIAIDGDKMYIKDVFPFLVNAKWIEGTIDNGMVTFTAGQIIGDYDDPESENIYTDCMYYGLNIQFEREDVTFSWDASTTTLTLTNYESGTINASHLPENRFCEVTDGTSDPSCTLTFKGTGEGPTPSTVTISANQDPQEADAYYSTYYNGTNAYQVDANTTIYQAILNGEGTMLSLEAVTEDIIPAGIAVILKSSSNEIELTPLCDPVTTTDYTENALKGVDVTTTVSTLGAGTIYTLAAEDNIMAFYKFVGAEIPAHKGYLQLPAGAPAPHRIGFGTNVTTGTENIEVTIKAEKIVRNGQLLIQKGDALYNAQGAIVK